MDKQEKNSSCCGKRLENCPVQKSRFLGKD